MSDKITFVNRLYQDVDVWIGENCTPPHPVSGIFFAPVKAGHTCAIQVSGQDLYTVGYFNPNVTDTSNMYDGQITTYNVMPNSVVTASLTAAVLPQADPEE